MYCEYKHLFRLRFPKFGPWRTCYIEGGGHWIQLCIYTQTAYGGVRVSGSFRKPARVSGDFPLIKRKGQREEGNNDAI